MLTFNNLNLTGGLTANAAPARDGSIYFNGSTDYLTTPNDTQFSFGTGDFTVEGWFYFNSITTDQCLIMLGTGANGGGPFAAWWLRYVPTAYGSPSLGFYRYDGTETPNNFTLSSSLSSNVWYHIACTRQSTNLRMFLNGIQVSTTITSSLNFDSVNADPVQIGKVTTGGGTFYLDAYLTNIRVVKGIAVYTANFTPSISILPSNQSANVYGVPSTAVPVANTALLLSAYNEPFYTNEYSANNRVISVLGAPGRSGFSPFY